MKRTLKKYPGCAVILMMAVGCLGILPSCRINEPTGTKGEELLVGQKIPDFKVRMDDGTEVSSASLEGAVNLIVFFHTMCGDCVRELPVLQKVYDRYKDDGDVNMILISRSQQKADVQAYWKKQGLSLPYSAQDNDEVYKKFALSVIPRVYVTDREIVIRFLHTDHPIATAKELLAEIEKLK